MLNEIVLPGEIVEFEEDGQCIAGPGLTLKGDKIVCLNSGLLKKKGKIFWVQFFQSKYCTQKGDDVIGIIAGKTAEAFKVDVGAGEPAFLNVLSFEGATKRSFPDLKIGDAVFCRIISSDNAYEYEVVCVDGKGKANGHGPLPSAQPSFLINVSCNYCRRILAESCVLLDGLTKLYKFEITIGHNGRIHVASSSFGTLLLVVNAILTAESLDNSQIQKMLRKLESKSFVDI